MMKPLTISSAQVKSLLLKLGNDNEEVWKPAFEELEYFDPRLAIDLQTLMERYMDSPTRQRMVEVMSGRQAGQLAGKEVSLRPVGQDGFNFFAQPNFGSWWAEHKIERINWDSRRSIKKKWTRAAHIRPTMNITTRINSQFPRPDFHRQVQPHYGLQKLVRPDGRGRRRIGIGSLTWREVDNTKRGPIAKFVMWLFFTSRLRYILRIHVCIQFKRRDPYFMMRPTPSSPAERWGLTSWRKRPCPFLSLSQLAGNIPRISRRPL
jgi:hypothetical protein